MPGPSALLVSQRYAKVCLVGRVGGARPGRKVLTLVHAMVAGASHIDHADMLRSGGTPQVLPLPVMAPSTLGTFLRAFTFGHVRQLEAVVGEALRRAWSLGGAPGPARLVIDVDSTVCEVVGKAKQGAAFGYTKVHDDLTAGPGPLGGVVDVDLGPEPRVKAHRRHGPRRLGGLGGRCRYQDRRLMVRRTLRGPAGWPWAAWLIGRLQRLRALRPVPG